MRDGRCVEFLQWVMPRLGLSWSGFRRVHMQVCKRLNRRLAELSLGDFVAYREYVTQHDAEWSVVDACCRITISRFLRDADVFKALADEILPRLARDARLRGAPAVHVWSAGCGAGEEPYSLALVWRFAIAPGFPGLGLRIVATDLDDDQIARARTGCYRASTLRDVPASWRARAFAGIGTMKCLRPEFRAGIEFLRQDLRAEAPRGPFDLVACRNLAFTYFDDSQQRQALAILQHELRPGGVLVIGRREHLPAGAMGLSETMPGLGVYASPPDAEELRESALGSSNLRR